MLILDLLLLLELGIVSRWGGRARKGLGRGGIGIFGGVLLLGLLLARVSAAFVGHGSQDDGWIGGRVWICFEVDS